ncbi:MAG TPA: NAD(P)-dependent oxidoreductase [Jiangellaceae bacterium]|nr:NAD(P)-dependent oxidoreductase [Jiangellaceae bacterium]
MSDPRVAVVGTGRMGAAMAARLRTCGADVVVHNRTRSRATAVAVATGATVAETPREAAAGADVVLVSLADDAACTEAYGGEDGIVAGLSAASVVADTSTVGPWTSRRLNALVGERDAAMLDAPVSGSVPVVERGELTVMVGGAADDLDRARSVLDLLAGRIVHVGPAGAGATMKLAVNSVVHALNQALAEALVLAERSGVDRGTAYGIFAASVVGGPFVQYKRAAFEDPNGTPVAFSLDLVAKDLDLVLELASQVGLPMRQAEVNRAEVGTAVAAGLGERDMSALADLLRVESQRPLDVPNGS